MANQLPGGVFRSELKLSDASKAIAERGGYELMPEWETKPANHYLPRSITETIAAVKAEN